MWPFSKKKFSILDSGLLQGMTDYHCHILPGVDDGVQTMDEAIHTLQELEKLGIKEIWLTPHIIEDYPNTPADLRQKFEELICQLSIINCQLVLHLAAEHMIDSLFTQRLAANEVLPLTLSQTPHPFRGGVPAGRGGVFPLSTLHFSSSRPPTSTLP